MRPCEALCLHRTRIREIALSHRVSGVRVFGSALHGDDVSGPGFARGRSRMSRADTLRIADYLQHMLEAINNILASRSGPLLDKLRELSVISATAWRNATWRKRA